MDKKIVIKTSKFLSLVLRHKPETIEIKLDDQGWTDVRNLLTQMKSHGRHCSMELLEYVVDTNDKKRFAFNENRTKIRANQGHSIKINLGYKPRIPPSVLFHGTAQKAVSGIFKLGIEKRKRHHVHLSSDVETASKVGKRHGKLVIFEVLAKKMHEDGHVFFLSENEVWLVEKVPVEFLRLHG